MCVKLAITALCALLAMKRTIAGSLYKCHAVTDFEHEDIHNGFLGETNIFPWLGVLKVYIRDEGAMITALTGIVFVTQKHALANADDIAKMPPWIFQKDTRAMFIPFHGKSLFYKLIDYITHPEYKSPTLNTIALLTLDAEGISFPMLPICWTRRSYRNLKHLYVVGFTDENQVLEKFIHKAKPVDPKSCDDFYTNEELNDDERRPSHYQCASIEMSQSCVWDTGTALVSNSTGYWVMVGFGVYGPGCASPARFIQFLPYISWIKSVVDPAGNYRRQGSESRRIYELLMDFNYLFDTEHHSYMYYHIDRISPQHTVIAINTVDEANCNVTKDSLLIYFDETKIQAPQSAFDTSTKSATYKLSLFDLYYKDIVCYHITLNATSYENAYVFTEDAVENWEATALTEWGDTPKEILLHYPLKNASIYKKPPPKKYADWTPGGNLRPQWIEDKQFYRRFKNHNILLKFRFQDSASFTIKAYGVPHPPPPVTTTEIMRATPTPQ